MQKDTNKLLYWLLGAMLVAILALGSCVATNLDDRVDRIKETQDARGERISRLETEVIELQRRMERAERNLEALWRSLEP